MRAPGGAEGHLSLRGMKRGSIRLLGFANLRGEVVCSWGGFPGGKERPRFWVCGMQGILEVEVEVKAGEPDSNIPSTELILEGKIILPGEHGLPGTRSTEGASLQGPSHFRQVGQGRRPTAMVCSSETQKSGGLGILQGLPCLNKDVGPTTSTSQDPSRKQNTSGGSKEFHLRKVLLRAAKG